MSSASAYPTIRLNGREDDRDMDKVQNLFDRFMTMNVVEVVIDLAAANPLSPALSAMVATFRLQARRRGVSIRVVHHAPEADTASLPRAGLSAAAES